MTASRPNVTLTAGEKCPRWWGTLSGRGKCPGGNVLHTALSVGLVSYRTVFQLQVLAYLLNTDNFKRYQSVKPLRHPYRTNMS